MLQLQIEQRVKAKDLQKNLTLILFNGQNEKVLKLMSLSMQHLLE